MDLHRIIDALQASLQPDTQAEAEKMLIEMHKIFGFAPALIQIVTENSIDMSVRQAGAVFFKNMVLKSWKERVKENTAAELPFHIHENDKDIIRNAMVSVMTSSPPPIQAIIKVSIVKILKCDYPDHFPTLIEQLTNHLSSLNFGELYGSLLCLYSLVEAFEHNSNDKLNLSPTMNCILPHIHDRMYTLLTDTSEQSISTQKLVLKIFYRYTNLFLPTESINEQWVTQWHNLICTLIENFDGISDDGDGEFWKRQKWAARILHCWFTRYGSPGNVQKKYNTFASWYLRVFVSQVLTSFLKVCDGYRQHKFVSQKFLAETISYFTAALSHSVSWKILNPSFDALLKEVIHPLLSHDKEAQELWEDDPLEFIRYKTSVYSGFHNPSDAACTFIKDACSKRKGILDKCMQYCIQVLSSDSEPTSKDGVLHLVGTVCETLLKNKTYKKQLETFLISYVLPLFEAPEGYRRARACWLLGKLSSSEFSNTGLLCQAAEATRRLTCFDPDLPVRVNAANTIFSLIKDQDETRKVMLPHLPDLVMQLVKLLRETEFDDLNSVLREIMLQYTVEIQPVAIHMLQLLSETFVKLVRISPIDGESDGMKASGDAEYNEEEEYQCLVATGVMENIETLLQVMEEQEELIAVAEPIIIQLVQIILKNNVTDFYDEAFSLVCSLTTSKISPLMWSVFDWLYQAFEKNAEDCFASMMPPLHNFVTIDPEGFISSPVRVEMLITMCSKTLEAVPDDDDDGDLSNEAVHAAKMFEILILNFREKMNLCVPKFVELALTRLTKTSTCIELRMMCLQVVIAAIISYSQIVLPILCTHNWPGTQIPIIENFLKIWMKHISKFTGLHDRRVCVLGLCTLLSLRSEERPPAVDKMCNEYLAALLLLLTGLKQAYTLRAQDDSEDDDDDDEDDDDDINENNEEEAIASDEDVIDEEGVRYLELLEAVETGTDDSDDDEDEDYETNSVMEEFDTELDKEECEMDEYVTFYQLMTGMEQSDPTWYQRLISPLTDSQKTEFKNIAETALKCLEQKQSKVIEKAGGYNFQQTNVPSSFNFSGNPPPGI